MKEVVVIGAGASGLASIRSLIKYKDKVNITAYEVSDRVGGLWVNKDPYKRTPMYDDLRTNVYRDIWRFADTDPIDVDESYVPHDKVLEYLERYADQHKMYQYIQFRHRVLEVDPFTTEDGTERWYVTVRNEETGAVTTKQFDAVMVCHGHHMKLHIPEIEGMKTFTGEMIHSVYYQNPDHYKDKTLVIVGGRFSAYDILFLIGTAAKKIYLSDHTSIFKTPLPANAERIPDISRLDGGDIILADGKALQADIILLATGYRFDFPFLTERCKPVIKDNHVTNIYRMMIDIDHPSLYYMGLNHVAALFYQYTFQAELAVAFITEKIPQVSKEDMRKEYEDFYKRHVTDVGRKPNDYHMMMMSQHEYATAIANESQTDVSVALSAVVEQLVARAVQNFSTNFAHTRESVYRIVGTDTLEVVYEHPVYDNLPR